MGAISGGSLPCCTGAGYLANGGCAGDYRGGAGRKEQTGGSLTEPSRNFDNSGFVPSASRCANFRDMPHHDWQVTLAEACGETERLFREGRERSAVLTETDHRLIVASMRLIEESRELLHRLENSN